MTLSICFLCYPFGSLEILRRHVFDIKNKLTLDVLPFFTIFYIPEIFLKAIVHAT